MLSVNNFSYSYPNSNKGVFDISFSLEPGKILAVVGNNGSGKTTLLNQLYKKYSENSAFVPQFFNISSFSVRDFVGLGLVSQFAKFQLNYSKEQKNQIEQILELTGLKNLAETPMTKISGGERQIAKIAQSLVKNPEVLFLDEPISHLDLLNSSLVLSLVRDICAKKKSSAVIILHDIYSVRKFADFVLMLKNGRQFGFCKSAEFDDKTVSELFGVII
jgi:ABC-type cobalamin/Fe3+-siderophores transport system ATPase subunit